jgi:LacI family transcriptional regulator
MAPSARRITIRDIAQAAGVSVATASKALNDTGRLAPETRARVKRIAAEVGFRPNALARGLLSRRSFTVGLLTNDTYGRFTLPVMAGISQALADHKISVFLCAVEDDPARAETHVEAMLDKQVDGIIASGKRIDRRLPVDLARLPVPVVYAFCEGTPDAVTLRADDAQGAALAVAHLRARGRRRLAHVTGPATFQSVRERAGAFADLAGAAPVLYGDWSEASGHAAVARLWSAPDPPDAVFCGNDQIARGVVDALRERGLAVPADVAVVGFDNWEIMAAQTRPPLTSVDMNLRELGRQAGLLVRVLAEGEAVAPGVRKLPCHLVVRDSCGGAPAKQTGGSREWEETP